MRSAEKGEKVMAAMFSEASMGLNEPVIKDSGTRREFETGAVRDIQEGKGRYDLLPWEAIHELALHCEQGALKYGERNCEKGIPMHSLIDSAIRHLSCYMRGMNDEPHLRAALWNISFAIWTEKNNPEMQDIPVRAGEDKKVTRDPEMDDILAVLEICYNSLSAVEEKLRPSGGGY